MVENSDLEKQREAIFNGLRVYTQDVKGEETGLEISLRLVHVHENISHGIQSVTDT